MRLLLLSCALLACGRDRPADVEPPDGPSVQIEDGNAILVAVYPDIANTGDTLTLDGTFGSNVQVTFPGGATASATVLGPHRAQVTVPATASTGLLVANSDGVAAGVSFRRVGFSLGMGASRNSYEQTDGARTPPVMTSPRSHHVNVVSGRWLYTLGGFSEATAVATTERARINADGSLGVFGPTAPMTTARAEHTTVRIGDFLYVIGGISGSEFRGNLERAAIAVDGTLGSFEAVTASLVTPRAQHSSIIVGSAVFVIGGVGADGFLTSIERAAIRSDGSIGAFVELGSLATARAQHTTLVAGNQVYVIGGAAPTPLGTIEQATISGDGSLGPFATSSSTLATPRGQHSSFTLGDAVYAVGGLGSAGTLSQVERATIQANGSLSEFEAVPSATLTVARQRHQTVIVGNFLYTVGGVGAETLASIERASLNESGQIAGFADASGVALNTPREQFGAAQSGKFVYATGGFECCPGGFIVPLNSVERATFDANGVLGPFVSLTTRLSTTRAQHATVIAGNQLYVIGGVNGVRLTSIESATINVDGSLGTFSPLASQLLTPRALHEAVVIEDFLYVIGGETNTGIVSSVERAQISVDGTLGTFSVVGAGLLTARREHALAVAGSKLFVVGGSTGGAELSTVEVATIAGDGTIGAFTQTSSQLVGKRSQLAVRVVGDSLIVLGGGADGEVIATTERAVVTNGTLGVFSQMSGAPLESARGRHHIAVDGNSLYVFGGQTGLGSVTSAERSTVASDGTLSAFVGQTSASLGPPRESAATAAIGDFFYTFGGVQFESGFQIELPNVQRAAVADDGSVGPFVKAPGGDLILARRRHSIATIGGGLDPLP